MKFFIDTANLDEIKAARDLGVLAGVTTNPTLVARENRPFTALIAEICELVDGPVSAEVTATTTAEMVDQAKELIKIADNIVVKLPTTTDGLRACVQCRKAGIRVNMTLIFQPLQALLVAKTGATFCSPFLGRLDDIGQDGMTLLSEIREIYDNYTFDTEILAASLRNPLHIVQAAKLGADVATMPLSTLDKLIRHPLTDSGLEQFMADWKAAGLSQ